MSVSFRDLRADPPSPEELRSWAGQAGVLALINRRSAIWRSLSSAEPDPLDPERAVALMKAHPALVRRPVVVAGQQVSVGLNEAAWEQMLSQ